MAPPAPERIAGCLHVASIFLHRPHFFCLKNVSHNLVPETANSLNTRYLFEEIVRLGPEKGYPIRKLIGLVASKFDHLFKDCDSVGQSDSHLRYSSCSKLSQVITVEGNKIPLRNILSNEFNIVTLETKTVSGSNEFTATANYFLHGYVVLHTTPEPIPWIPLSSARARNIGKRIAVLEG